MTHKRIYILNGHPAENSLTRNMAEAYAKAASEAGHEVRLTHLHDLEFDPDFGFGGFETIKPLEPQLEQVLSDIEWSQHMVLATPMWWGGLPAKLKGVIDRAFLPGRAFDTRRKTSAGLPAPLLGGRTGRVLLLSDTPGWFFRLAYRNALMVQLKGQILGFIGLKPVKITHFTGASEPEAGRVEGWLRQSAQIGAKAV